MHRRHVYASKLLTWLMESSFIIREGNRKERKNKRHILAHGTAQTSTPRNIRLTIKLHTVQQSTGDLSRWMASTREETKKNTCCEAAAGFWQSPPKGRKQPPPLAPSENTDFMIFNIKEEDQSWISGCWWAKRNRDSSFFLFGSESAELQ